MDDTVETSGKSVLHLQKTEDVSSPRPPVLSGAVKIMGGMALPVALGLF